MSTTMRALAVHSWDQNPSLSTVPKPPQPDNDDSQVQIKVLASGLPNLVRSQASGRHYSTANAKLPYIPGADGVGFTESGEIVYFSSLGVGGGAFADYINLPKTAVFTIPFPAGTSDDEKKSIAVRIAALVNPAMASWLAFKTRTHNVPEGFTVLINGVTSISGKIAISHARALGARKVIGLGRSEDALKQLDLDQYIVVQDPAEQTDFAGQLAGQHIDIILDFVYGGGSTLHLFKSLPGNPARAHELEIQYVQIGSLGGAEMDLPSALLRSKNLVIRGSGPGAWSVTNDLRTNFPGLLQRLVEGVGDFEYVERKLEDVEAAWADKKARSVFVM